MPFVLDYAFQILIMQLKSRDKAGVEVSCAFSYSVLKPSCLSLYPTSHGVFSTICSG